MLIQLLKGAQNPILKTWIVFFGIKAVDKFYQKKVGGPYTMKLFEMSSFSIKTRKFDG